MENVDGEIAKFLGADQGAPKRKGKPGGKKRNGNRKMYKYAKTQELYKQNPGFLVKHVREGID